MSPQRDEFGHDGPAGGDRHGDEALGLGTSREVTNADLLREMRLTRQEVATLNQHIVNSARPQDGLLMRVHRLEQNWQTAVKVFVAAVLFVLPAVGTALVLGIKAWLHNDNTPGIKP